MRIKILNRLWNLRRDKLPKGIDGKCDHPSTQGKSIIIRRSLKGERELEVLLHEMAHAGDWHKDEEWVQTVASDIARVLWKLGYRKEK